MVAKKDLGDILASIDELAQRGQITRSRAFASWFAINFFSVDEDEALEGAAADGGNDQGIDLVFFDDTSESIIVLQAHCPDNTDKKPRKVNGMLLLRQSHLSRIQRSSSNRGGRIFLKQFLLSKKLIQSTQLSWDLYLWD